MISNKNKRICVLGNYSGRNAGDMAILGNLIQDISNLYADIHFIVPTLYPDFVKNSFPKHSVEPMSLQPWALSLKIFGLPIFRAVLRSDLVLVTDNILFDMKLFNPIFNYLSTLSIVLPLAQRRGIPIILYNMSLGPISTPNGKRLFERVIRSCELIILRDTQSQKLIERLEIPHGRIEFGADSAINTEPCSSDHLQSIIRSERLFQNPSGTIGININTYLDAYLTPGGRKANRQQFTYVISQAVDRVIDATGLDVLFIVTQVMDIKVTNEVLNNIKHKDKVRVISNKKYSYVEIASIMEKLELLVGMRTHALILASSLGTPVVGIISYPKTAGYLQSIQQDSWTIHFNDLSVDSLSSLILKAYEQRSDIRSSLVSAIQSEKLKARESARLLSPFIINLDDSSQ
jgi:polysaccharide pyruvyl transferase WcaK-like protein